MYNNKLRSFLEKYCLDKSLIQGKLDFDDKRFENGYEFFKDVNHDAKEITLKFKIKHNDLLLLVKINQNDISFSVNDNNHIFYPNINNELPKFICYYFHNPNIINTELLCNFFNIEHSYNSKENIDNLNKYLDKKFINSIHRYSFLCDKYFNITTRFFIKTILQTIEEINPYKASLIKFLMASYKIKFDDFLNFLIPVYQLDIYQLERMKKFRCLFSRNFILKTIKSSKGRECELEESHKYALSFMNNTNELSDVDFINHIVNFYFDTSDMKGKSFSLDKRVDGNNYCFNLTKRHIKFLTKLTPYSLFSDRFLSKNIYRNNDVHLILFFLHLISNCTKEELDIISKNIKNLRYVFAVKDSFITNNNPHNEINMDLKNLCKLKITRNIDYSLQIAIDYIRFYKRILNHLNISINKKYSLHSILNESKYYHSYIRTINKEIENKVIEKSLNFTLEKEEQKAPELIPEYYVTFNDRKYYVKQLISGVDLIKEGEKMSHCVGDYAIYVLTGDSIIFSISRDDSYDVFENSTLEIGYDMYDNKFQIRQHLSYDNYDIENPDYDNIAQDILKELNKKYSENWTFYKMTNYIKRDDYDGRVDLLNKQDYIDLCKKPFFKKLTVIKETLEQTI